MAYLASLPRSASAVDDGWNEDGKRTRSQSESRGLYRTGCALATSAPLGMQPGAAPIATIGNPT